MVDVSQKMLHHAETLDRGFTGRSEREPAHEEEDIEVLGKMSKEEMVRLIRSAEGRKNKRVSVFQLSRWFDAPFGCTMSRNIAS